MNSFLSSIIVVLLFFMTAVSAYFFIELKRIAHFWDSYSLRARKKECEIYKLIKEANLELSALHSCHLK